MAMMDGDTGLSRTAPASPPVIPSFPASQLPSFPTRRGFSNGEEERGSPGLPGHPELVEDLEGHGQRRSPGLREKGAVFAQTSAPSGRRLPRDPSTSSG